MLAGRLDSRPTIFCGRLISDLLDGPALPPHVRRRRPARLVLGRRARARLHAVRGLPAHRGAGGRRRRACCCSRRPVEPTEAGARLLEHAEPILLRLDAARADVARVAAGPPQVLRIGATPLAAALRGRAGRAGAGGDRARRPRATRSPARWRRASSTRASSTASPRSTTRCACPRPGCWWPRSTRSRSPSRSPRDHPLAGRAIALEDLVDARWIDAPGDLRAARRARRDRPRRRLPAGAALRRVRRRAGCSRWSPPGTGSRCCPRARWCARRRPRRSPRPPLVHRTELLAHRGITTPPFGVVAHPKDVPARDEDAVMAAHRPSRPLAAPRPRLPAAGRSCSSSRAR